MNTNIGHYEQNCDTLRVLIAEDSADDALLLVHELEKGEFCDIHWQRVETPDQLKAVLSEPWDIVFADYNMPTFTGVDALRIIRDQGLQMPFIFVSGAMGEDIAVAAMKAGAQDYFVKGNWRRLLPAVERELKEAKIRQALIFEGAKRHKLEARFRNVLAAAADAIVSIDESRKVSIFNRAAERIFNQSAEEMLGQSINLLLDDASQKALAQVMTDLAHSPGQLSATRPLGSLQANRKNEKSFPIEASISSHWEENDLIFTLILRDITERNQADEELRLLQAITRVANEASDVTGAVAATLREICMSAGCAMAQAWMPTADKSRLECIPAWHANKQGLEAFRQASLNLTLGKGDDLAGRVWATGKPLWIRDMRAQPKLVRAALATQVGLVAGLAVPVLSAGKLIAVLEFFGSEPRPQEDRLIEVLSSVSEQLASVIQRKRAEEHLQYLAYHDTLTGLPNRALFIDRLKQAMMETHRRNRIVGVAFIDLDRFKHINDSLGHGMGDQLLQAIGQRLSGCLRQSDTVARLGGDEFAMILTDLTDPIDATGVAEKILSDVSQTYRIDDHEIYTGASLGITLYPQDGDSVDCLLHNADIAMYRAKEARGNAYAFYSPEMTAKAKIRLTMENALRHGLDRGELVLHYQPIVDITTRQSVGLEALVRWHHPERGLLLPDSFIPLAEETGIIIRMGSWILQRACAQIGAGWEAQKNTTSRLSVNVSPRQFQRGNFAHVVAGALEKSGLAPHRLELEITEGLLLQDTKAAIATMRELASIGVGFSIDDFGTGYSSLAYLSQLPINQLKIDRSFIRNFTTNTNDDAIVTAIISMAHGLGLRTVAEGVETQAQLDRLQAYGCDTAQGYIFSLPLPVAEALSAPDRGYG